MHKVVAKVSKIKTVRAVNIQQLNTVNNSHTKIKRPSQRYEAKNRYTKLRHPHIPRPRRARVTNSTTDAA